MTILALKLNKTNNRKLRKSSEKWLDFSKFHVLPNFLPQHWYIHHFATLLVLFKQLSISKSFIIIFGLELHNKISVKEITGLTSFTASLAFLSINCFVNFEKENRASFLPRTISICLYFAQSRLYKRFNFEVEVSLGKFWKQVCITSQSGRPTREIWRKKPNWKKS